MGFRDDPTLPVVYVAAADTPAQFASAAQYRCDGVNDETEILAAAAAVQGGTVRLLAGTFHIGSEIAVPGFGTRLEGESARETVLLVDPGFAAGQDVINLSLQYQGIARVYIDVNNVDLGGIADVALSTSGSEIRVEDVTIVNVAGGRPIALGTTTARGLRVFDCTTPEECRIVNATTWLEGCVFNNVAAPIDIGTEATLSNSDIDGCGPVYTGFGAKLVNVNIENATGVGVRMLGSRSQMIGGLVQVSAGDAIEVGSDDLIVQGVVVNAPTGRGLVVGSDSDRALINGLRLVNVQGAVDMQLDGNDALVVACQVTGGPGAVNLGALSNNVVLVTNRLGGAVITDSGTGNTIAPNY